MGHTLRKIADLNVDIIDVEPPEIVENPDPDAFLEDDFEFDAAPGA